MVLEIRSDTWKINKHRYSRLFKEGFRSQSTALQNLGRMQPSRAEDDLLGRLDSSDRCPVGGTPRLHCDAVGALVIGEEYLIDTISRKKFQVGSIRSWVEECISSVRAAVALIDVVWYPECAESVACSTLFLDGNTELFPSCPLGFCGNDQQSYSEFCF